MHFALLFGAVILPIDLAAAGGGVRPLETVTVLVARADIPPGKRIEEPEKLFKSVRYVKGDEPKDALTKFEQLKGRRVNKSLYEDQPVKAKDLIGQAVEPPPGTRAVAVRVRPESVQSGFVLPLSRVDVLQTVRNDRGEATTKTVFRGLLVLATNYLDREPGNVTATLAVRPDDVKALRLAEATGDLSLALSTHVQETPGLKPVRPESLGPDSPPPVRRPPDR